MFQIGDRRLRTADLAGRGPSSMLLPYLRSIPTVLRPDQKQKGTAPVLRVQKIKELPAQFLDRGLAQNHTLHRVAFFDSDDYVFDLVQ